MQSAKLLIPLLERLKGMGIAVTEIRRTVSIADLLQYELPHTLLTETFTGSLLTTTSKFATVTMSMLVSISHHPCHHLLVSLSSHPLSLFPSSLIFPTLCRCNAHHSFSPSSSTLNPPRGIHHHSMTPSFAVKTEDPGALQDSEAMRKGDLESDLGPDSGEIRFSPSPLPLTS